MKNACSFWVGYKELWKLLFANATIFIAGYNLQKLIDNMVANSLSELRSKLNSDTNSIVHSYLLDDEDKAVIDNGLETYFIKRTTQGTNVIACNGEIDHGIVNAALFDYLGTLELGMIMYDRGLMTLEEFRNQFEYRYKEVFNNSSINQYIHKNEAYFKILLKAKKYIDQ